MKRRGSVMLVILMMVVILAHGALAAVPLWSGAAERERARDLAARAERLNQALHRYTARTGHGPSTLDDLTRPEGHGPFLARVEEDPWTGTRPWTLTRDGSGAITVVSVATPSQP